MAHDQVATGEHKMDTSTPNVGPRIRMLREQRGLSLRALSTRCALSINAISLIERGENSPTVSSLQQLASALGVKITDFFQEAHDHDVVFVKRDQRLTAQGSGFVSERCGDGVCQEGACFERVCEPGGRSCDAAGRLLICDELGIDPKTEDCDRGEFCEEGICLPQRCH